jgi:hypothetical protein
MPAELGAVEGEFERNLAHALARYDMRLFACGLT